MSMRNVGGGLGGLVVLGIVLFLKFGLGSAMSAAKEAEFGEETKAEFLEVLAGTPVCEGNGKNYVDWLADSCHEQAWKDNHTLEYRSRRQTDCVIDGDGYARDMLTLMMDMARRENAPQVAEGLGKVFAEAFPIE